MRLCAHGGPVSDHESVREGVDNGALDVSAHAAHTRSVTRSGVSQRLGEKLAGIGNRSRRCTRRQASPGRRGRRSSGSELSLRSSLAPSGIRRPSPRRPLRPDRSARRPARRCRRPTAGSRSPCCRTSQRRSRRRFRQGCGGAEDGRAQRAVPGTCRRCAASSFAHTRKRHHRAVRSRGVTPTADERDIVRGMA